MRDEVTFLDSPPSIFVAGLSSPRPSAICAYLAHRGETWQTDTFEGPEALAEAAGRVCYHSWRNPGKKTRQQYLQESIIAHGHGSVLECVTVNLLCADVPRHTQLELVRHRAGAAYSWESTRYTNKHLRIVIPPRIRDDPEARAAFETTCREAVRTYWALVERAERETDEGTLRRKRALEAARSVLPNALASDGMVTLNARALRHIIALRTDEHADLSMREFAYALYRAVSPFLPAVFADASVCPSPDNIPVIQFASRKV